MQGSASRAILVSVELAGTLAGARRVGRSIQELGRFGEPVKMFDRPLDSLNWETGLTQARPARICA